MEHSYAAFFKRVALSPLEGDDFESLRLLRNQVRQWFRTSEIVSYVQQQQWRQSYLEAAGDFMFKVARQLAPDVFIGATALYNVDTEKRNAVFGRLVIDKTKISSEKGLGLDATLATMSIAFFQLNLQSVYLEVLANNIPAIKTYQRAGFKQISESQDLLGMAITIEDFFEVLSRS